MGPRGQYLHRMNPWVGLWAALPLVLISACGGSSSSPDSAADLDLPIPVFESAAVREVKGGVIKACPTATLGEMADSFFPDADWRDFTATSGASVVELTGSFYFQDLPAEALIQFVVEPVSGFEATYIEINGQPGNLIQLSALLDKMCEST